MRFSFSPLALHSLLIALISVLLFVRMVDLHWHQPLTGPQGDAGAALHLADASTPHAADHLDTDVNITGDEGVAHKLPLLPILAAGLSFIFVLLLPSSRLLPVRSAAAAPPRSARTRLPPGRGPPQLLN